MNKNISIKYIILILCCSVIVGLLVCQTNVIYYRYKNYKESVEYLEKTYTKDPTKNNLMKLCGKCMDTNNMKYLDYADKLLNLEDCGQIVLDYYKDNPELTNQSNSDSYKDICLLLTMSICAKNNDIDKFIFAMNKYYPQLPLEYKHSYFYDVLIKQNSAFIMDNKDIIIKTVYSLIIESNDPPQSKLVDLISILSFYQVIDQDNPQVETIKGEIKNARNLWKSIDDKTFAELHDKISKTYVQYWTNLQLTGSPGDISSFSASVLY